MNAHFIPLAILIGAALSSQPAINQTAVRVLGTPIAAAIVSVIVTLILMVAYLLATGAKVQAASLFNLPWWIVLGGAAGFLFVFGGVTVAPAIGAAVRRTSSIPGPSLAIAQSSMKARKGSRPTPA